MRSYLGERDTFGRPIVWVLDKPEGPGAAEVAAFAADLRAHVCLLYTSPSPRDS